MTWLTIVANCQDRMKRAAKLLSGFGCSISILAPLLALLIYPRANWLFWLALVGIAVLVLNHRFAKDPTPHALAEEIERLLTGTYIGWDVDDFEHRSIRDPQLSEVRRRSMEVGGLPEEWIRLEEEQKHELREIIRQLRELGNERDAAKCGQ